MIYLALTRLPNNRVSICAWKKHYPKDLFQGEVALRDLETAGLAGSRPMEDLKGRPILSDEQWRRVCLARAERLKPVMQKRLEKGGDAMVEQAREAMRRELTTDQMFGTTEEQDQASEIKEREGLE